MKGTVVVLGLCAQPDTFMPFAAVAKEVRIQPSAFFTHHDYKFSVDVLDRARRRAPRDDHGLGVADGDAGRVRGAASPHAPMQGHGPAGGALTAPDIDGVPAAAAG